MHAFPQPATGYSKGDTVANSGTHLWYRHTQYPRHWLVVPTDVNQPVFLAVVDDQGSLVPVEAWR